MKAGHPDTSEDELEVLSRHEHHHIRRRVAENDRTPVKVLMLLARDEHAEVRVGVAEHPRTPQEILDRLAADESLEVRHSLAENHNLPMSILLRLAEDENPYVSHRAWRTLRRLQPPDIAELGPNPYSGGADSYALRRMPFDK